MMNESSLVSDEKEEEEKKTALAPLYYHQFDINSNSNCC